MRIKTKVYKYQGIGKYNAGEVSIEWFERDAKSCDLLDVICTGWVEVGVDVEPVEMDCELARKQLKKRAIEEERNKLQEQLDKLNAA